MESSFCVTSKAISLYRMMHPRPQAAKLTIDEKPASIKLPIKKIIWDGTSIFLLTASRNLSAIYSSVASKDVGKFINILGNNVLIILF